MGTDGAKPPQSVRDGGLMKTYNYRLFFWEEGSRPGTLKIKLVHRDQTLSASDDDDATKKLQKIAAMAERTSYSQVRFTGLHWDDSAGKRWEITTPANNEYHRWLRGTERPASWGNLNPEMQAAVAMVDRAMGSAAADRVAMAARKFGDRS
jgi:hypothetical protein